MQRTPEAEQIEQPQSIEDRLGNFLDEDEEFQEPEATNKPEPEVEDGLQETQETDEPDAEEAEEVEGESISVESLAELAEHIGADVADLYNLKLPVTGPDGQKAEVTLGEYKDSYREAAMVRAEREKITAEAEQVRSDLTQKAQFLDVAYTQANVMLQAAEKQLLSDFSGVEQLQATDPTQYVLKKQQLTEKQNELNGLRQQAIQNYQQQQHQVMQQQEAQRQQFLYEQSQQLTEIIPEWKDEQVRTSEQSELSNYLISSGIPEQEVSMIERAAVVDLARKAMLYDKMQKVKPDSKKKVVTIGKKVIKTSAKPKRSAVKANKLQQARKTLRSAKGTRNTNDAVASLLENHFLEDL